jgi:hypothetical protein
MKTITLECGNCEGSRQTKCEAIFYGAACSLDAMTQAGESLAERSGVTEALNFGETNQIQIVNELEQSLGLISCRLSSSEVKIKLQQEVEAL